MRRKLVVGVIALIVLGSLVVLGNSPDLVRYIIETVSDSSVSQAFRQPDAPISPETKQGQPETVFPDLPAANVPDRTLWHMLFLFKKKLR